jgi:flagellar biosynthesis protein FlhB
MKAIFLNSASFQLLDTTIYQLFLDIVLPMATLMTPLFVTVLIGSIAGNLLQTGFLFTLEPLAPKLSRLSVLQGLKRLFSPNSWLELPKSVIKIGAVGTITYLVVKGQAENIPSLMQLGVEAILSFIGTVSFKIFFYPCVALTALAVLDYAFQRWQYEQSLKMTKQEVREELKQREGDPLIKGRIRRIQMEVARRRMMEAVKQADVIITNPTTLAIALRYDAETMVAPRVVAKGAGFIAERIREIAHQTMIPIVENKPLAQTLFKVVAIGEHVPVSLYRAVAEILAYVYRLKEHRRPL